MPNWKIHLEVGKRVVNKTKYNDLEQELFLFGNIIPDINNGFVVNNVSKILKHSYTHYQQENHSTYQNFYKQYENKIKDPIIFGYFVHLYTDYIWNENFYENKAPNLRILYDNDTLRKIKQNDFRVFNNLFMKNYLELSDFSYALNSALNIDRISISKEDIDLAINFIKNQKETKDSLLVYKNEELEGLLSLTVEKTIEIIEKLNI